MKLGPVKIISKHLLAKDKDIHTNKPRPGLQTAFVRKTNLPASIKGDVFRADTIMGPLNPGHASKRSGADPTQMVPPLLPSRLTANTCSSEQLPRTPSHHPFKFKVLVFFSFCLPVSYPNNQGQAPAASAPLPCTKLQSSSSF